MNKKIVKKIVKQLKSEFNDEEDFSRYLAENLDLLSPILEVDLEEVVGQNEVPVGPFRCDVVAQGIDESYIVVENQLGQSHHDHLGGQRISWREFIESPLGHTEEVIGYRYGPKYEGVPDADDP